MRLKFPSRNEQDSTPNAEIEREGGGGGDDDDDRNNRNNNGGNNGNGGQGRRDSNSGDESSSGSSSSSGDQVLSARETQAFLNEYQIDLPGLLTGALIMKTNRNLVEPSFIIFSPPRLKVVLAI